MAESRLVTELDNMVSAFRRTIDEAEQFVKNNPQLPSNDWMKRSIANLKKAADKIEKRATLWKETYRAAQKAFPEKPTEELENMAADKVRDIYGESEV